MNKYIININDKVNSKFGDYIRTSNELGNYNTVLKAVIDSYNSEDELYKNYKLFCRFTKESKCENIDIVLFLLLCDCILYNKAIAEQLRNMYTFFHQIPYAYTSKLYQKLIAKHDMVVIHDNYIDIGKMLPDKDYLSDSFMSRFELSCMVEPELKTKDGMISFKKVKGISDKLVMYGKDVLGYTDVITLDNRKLTYLFINKKDVEFRQISYDNGYMYHTLGKENMDRVESKIFGKVIFT